MAAPKKTTPKKTTVKKAVTAKAKPAAPKTVSSPVAVKDSEPAQAKPSVHAVPDNKVKRSEFVARVAERAGLRPNQVKPVLEAVLEELGQVLLNGEELKHPSLGKLSVNRHKELAKADVVHCKLRRSKEQAPSTTAPDPLATAAE